MQGVIEIEANPEEMGMDLKKLEAIRHQILLFALRTGVSSQELAVVCASIQEDVLEETGVLAIFPNSRARAAECYHIKEA